MPDTPLPSSPKPTDPSARKKASPSPRTTVANATPTAAASPAQALAPAANPVLAIPAQPPAIPLSKENYALYQDLYNKIQTAIASTKDGTAIETLMDPRDEVKAVLDNNDTYDFTHNTSLVAEVLTQINQTNSNLITLKNEINAVATHIATAATILAAIDKLTQAIPAF